jgi:DNA-binding GntR family transcriptional regulator
VTYVARKGYAVTELDYAALEEIYHLRALLERDAVERGLPLATDDDIDELEEAAAACREAAVEGDVTTELAANRRFHFLLYGLAGSEQQLRLIRLLWDGTEAYRAIYYGTPGGEDEADRAHRAIVDAARDRDVPRCVAELRAHRERALTVLHGVLAR